MLEKYDRILHNTDDVKSLLALAVGYPTPERLKNLLDIVYDIQGYQLYVAVDDGLLAGVIGLDATAAPHGWILHLAVRSELRQKGLGRAMITELMHKLSLTSVGLETDDDAVDFYRACGFTATEIHSRWPGVRRYRCLYGNMPAGVLEYYDRKELKF